MFSHPEGLIDIKKSRIAFSEFLVFSCFSGCKNLKNYFHKSLMLVFLPLSFPVSIFSMASIKIEAFASLLTNSNLICSSANPHIFPPTHLPIFFPSHLPIFSPSYFPIFSLSHLPIFIPSYPHIFSLSPLNHFAFRQVLLHFLTTKPCIAQLLFCKECKLVAHMGAVGLGGVAVGE